MANKLTADQRITIGEKAHGANVYGPVQEKKVHLHDHFQGTAIDGTNDYTIVIEGDNDAIAVSSSDSGGWASFLSGDTDDEACSLATRLSWRAYENCACEARFKMADVSQTAVFFGFTDAVNEGQVLPISYVGGSLTATADDAFGIVIDADKGTSSVYLASEIALSGSPQSVDLGVDAEDDEWIVARLETSTDVDGHINVTTYVTIGTVTYTGHIFTAVTATDYLCMMFASCTRDNGGGDYVYLDRWDAWQDEVA